jgi:HEAT repeat protein
LNQEKDNSLKARAVLKKLSVLNDPRKRLRMLRAVAKLNAAWAPEVLIEALGDPNEIIRDYIAEELGNRPAFGLTLVCQKLVHQPWYIKCAALKILGARKAAETVSLIKVAAADANAEVRRCAACALGEIGGKEALGSLVALSKDKNGFVRRAAVEALRKASEIRFS